MGTPEISSIRKKKIKTLLTMMNKQNRRLIPIASPLIEMMHMTTTDEELDYLLQMGIGLYDYDHALKSAAMPKEQFHSFFDTMQRKGLVHIEYDSSFHGQEPFIFRRDI